MLLKKLFIFVGIFYFSHFAFSSELSVKEVAKTQQSEPSVKEASEKEKESDLSLLTDKEYNEILNSLTSPSYYNFKRVLEYMDITSLKEYLDFLETLEVEHFPKSPKKYYGNQWEGWSQKSVIEPIDKKTDKSIEFSVNKILELDSEKTEESKREEALKLNRQEVLKLKREEALKLKRENKGTSYKSLSLKHQNKKTKKPSRVGAKKKNWMSFAEAQALMQKEGIKTYTEFKEWKKAGKRPPNFPANPHIIYAEDWKGWPHFLGTEEIRFKKWMSFTEAQALMQKEGIKTYTEFKEWKRAGKRPANFPGNPDIKYKKDWVSWYHFLGKKWMSYAEAQAYIQKEGIKTVKEFKEWKRVGKRPPNFPSRPDIKYKKDWKGWSHFLGRKVRVGKKGVSYNNWMSYEEAQALMQKEGIKTVKQFREWKRAGKRPANFPGNPDIKYKKDWKGWSHFLGRKVRVGKKGVSYNNWMSYEEAQALMQKEGIKTVKQFREWKRVGKRPANFPGNPDIKYKKEWVSWPHFLGTEGMKISRKNWMSFVEAQILMQTEGIKTEKEFKEWKKAGKRPPNFPSHPNTIYAEDWVSWPHFLGTKIYSSATTKWMSFEEAQALMQKEGIKTVKQFQIWKRAGKRPPNFPSIPHKIYKDKWRGWPHFLGTRMYSATTEWMSFEEAQAYIQKEGIKTTKEFYEWSKSGNRPSNFPSIPYKIYKDKWVSWPHFFGTVGIKISRKNWMSFEKAQALMQKEGIKTVRQFTEWKRAGKRPPNFPGNPHKVYKKDWVSWYHFFGTAKCKKAFK